MVAITQNKPEPLKLDDGTIVKVDEIIDLDAASAARSVRQYEKLRSREQAPMPPVQAYREFHLPPHVPVSIDPAVVEGTGEELDAMRRVLSEMRAAAERTLNAAAAVHADETATVPRRHVVAAELAMRHSKPGLKAFDGFYAAFQKKLDQMEAEISLPKRPSDLGSNSDIGNARSALHAMDSTRRNNAIARAIKAGDEITACAVLYGPAYLCGLRDEEQQRWRLEWRQARFGDRIKQIEHFRKQLEHVERAGRLLQTLSFQMYDRGIVERATKLREAARSAAAS